MSDRSTWTNTTHDWAVTVDLGHLDSVRRASQEYAPGGLLHLVLEVMAYANDEAETLGRPGNCVVTLHGDGSVSVADDGRGTDTRGGDEGPAVKKPVMATRDLRFFDAAHDMRLPDGHLRRGMSVVSALSTWLTHTNRRANGAWLQRYGRGIPSTGLVSIEPSQTTGTTVRFLVDQRLVPVSWLTEDDRRRMVDFGWLHVEFRGV